MATSGGATAPFRMPAASGHDRHIQDSSLILRCARTLAVARQMQAWIFPCSALREWPALGPLPRLEAGKISQLHLPTHGALLRSFLVPALAAQLDLYAPDKFCLPSVGLTPRRHSNSFFFYPHGRPSSSGK